MKQMIAALTVLAIAGCGGSTSAGHSPPSQPTKATHSKPAPTPSPKPTPTLDLQPFNDCTYVTKPMLMKLKALDARLGVGMVQADYNRAVGDIAVAENLEKDRIAGHSAGGLGCLKVFTAMVFALSDYETANTIWSNCNSSLSCNLDKDKLPIIRSWWTKGGTSLANAERLLAKMDPR